MSLTEAGFWQMIERSRAKAKRDDETFIELLTGELGKLEPDEIIEFHHIFWKFYRISYRTDLWGAGFIMNGGCSDDGFDYFRGWLISQGKKVFDAALENPDSLAKAVPKDPETDVYELEEMLSVGQDVWRGKTGLSDEDYYQQLGEFEDYPALGEFEWSDGEGDIDEVKGKRLYPKLWKKFDG
jgi:hypothetical protein